MRLSSSRSTAILHRPQQDFLLWDKAGTRPSLDQQLADRKDLIDAISGQQLITHTRASAGTYVGSDGLIKTATTNEARFDHDPVTGESLGLLVEESRTNLLLQSEDFSTTWTATRASVSTNAIIAPNGAITADKLIEDNSLNNTHLVVSASGATTVAGLQYVYSVFAKAAERSWILLSPGGAWGYAWFDVLNGVVGSVVDGGSSPTASIQPVGNGWFRCSIGVTAVDAKGYQILLATGNNVVTYTGDGTSGIYLWGAQLEAGSFPTSYIPTTSSTVTRAADVLTDTSTGANIRTLYAEFRSPGLAPIPSCSSLMAAALWQTLTPER
jgi:hypothetical protein